MKKFLKFCKDTWMVLGCIFFILCLIVACLIFFCGNWIYESFYKKFFPKKWEAVIAQRKIKKEKEDERNLSRGWAYQPNLFGEH